MRAALYTRISDDREGKGLGVARQESECRELAGRLGLEISTVFSDNSISAFKGKVRPQYRAMLEAIRHQEFDVIVVYAADRLTRHPRELEDLVDALDSTGTKVQTVISGEYDLTTSDGRAYARIVGAIARQESERKSERLRSQKRQAAASGERAGGPRAFGWTQTRKAFVPSEIAVVRELGERALAGEGIATMVRDINARGITSAQGKAWSRQSLRRMLVNPATAGLRRQPDGSVVKGQWEGAWDKETWDRLRTLLEHKSRTTTHRLRVFLLTGLAVDPSGRKLVTGYRRKGRIYRTMPSETAEPLVGGVTISADLVEEIVVEAVLRLTDSLVLPKPDFERPSEVDELQAQLDVLAEMFGSGNLTASEWNLARDRIAVRLSEARKRLPTAPKVSDMEWARPGLLRAKWDGLTIQQRRTAIEVFVSSIVIGPGMGAANSADRVTVIWKR